jgi:hypothetical protein
LYAYSRQEHLLKIISKEMKKVIAIATIATFALMSSTASAFFWSGSSSDVNISNTNTATVVNTVGTSANTGYNTSNGDSATNNVSGKGSNGGNTVGGGFGGIVVTGNAGALSSVLNDVNSSKTVVNKDCGCKGDVNISGLNVATVANTLLTEANTGNNTTNGAEASNTVVGSHGWSWGHHSSNWNGGNLVVGGNGGTVGTGEAVSAGAVVNLVNSNVTRVR